MLDKQQWELCDHVVVWKVQTTDRNILVNGLLSKEFICWTAQGISPPIPEGLVNGKR